MAKEYQTKQRLHSGDHDFKTRYPFSRCEETESGHIVCFDDTPEGPIVAIAHECGSYVMMTTEGKVINFSVGDTQSYSKGGVSLSIDENNDIKIHGHCRMVVGGGSYIEVAGDAGVGVAGDVTLVSKGNLHASVDNIYMGAKGDMNMNVNGDMKMKVAGQMNFEASGDTYMTAKNIRFNDPSDSGAGGVA